MHAYGRAAYAAMETNGGLQTGTNYIDRFGYNTGNNDHGRATVEVYDAYHDADYW